MIDGPVKLLVCANRLSGIKVASSDDMAIGRVEIESTGNIVEVGYWQILSQSVSA